MKKTLLTRIKRAAREVPETYFAPLVGVVRGIQEEYRRIEQKRSDENRSGKRSQSVR